MVPEETATEETALTTPADPVLAALAEREVTPSAPITTSSVNSG